MLTKKAAFCKIADTEDYKVALGLAGSHFKDATKLIGVLFGDGDACVKLDINDPRVIQAVKQKWPITR